MAKASVSLSDARKRLYILGAVLFFWIAIICCRLVQVQVVSYGEWIQRAQRQQQRTIEISPQRGIVYDRNGNELAMSIMVDSIFAVPSEIKDHETTATLLASVLHTDEKEILNKLDGSRNFCWIARKVNSETSDRIQRLGIRGIYAQKEPKRFYPKRDLAAQVLGYVGLDDEGLGGIERQYEDELRGHAGRLKITRDARGAKLARNELKSEPGQNVVLTIDEKIQYIAEREIDRAMEETRAVGATIIVQNPRTGEILALANRPTFNPNTFNTVPDVKALKNHAVSDIFEPGSMFKTVTVSAALEEKVVRPDDRWDASQGYIVVGGARMRDAHRMGVLTTSQVIAQSSNVGAIKIGMKLGDDRLYKYMRAFGFGDPTGIELPGETRGLVKPVKYWSKTSIGAMSMGQEVGVTPIQVASAFSMIANDGVYNAPRIVAGVTVPNAGPQQITFKPAAPRRVLSTLTAAQMKQMLEGVVLFGTGRKAILDGYTSAGKTGTAQKIDPATRRYGRNYVGSFTGFAPVNNPAVTVAVIIDSAQGLHQGGQVSAPVWARVTQQVLEYMNVPHDVELKSTQRELLRAKANDKDLEEESGDRLGAAMDFTAVNNAEPELPAKKNALRAAKFVPSPAKSGTPVQQIAITGISPKSASTPAPQPIEPSAPQPSSANQGVVIDTAGATVPAFVGKSLRSAVEAALQAGVQIDARGTGIAREQSPPPGSRIGPGMKVLVKFGR